MGFITVLEQIRRKKTRNSNGLNIQCLSYKRNIGKRDQRKHLISSMDSRPIDDEYVRVDEKLNLNSKFDTVRDELIFTSYKPGRIFRYGNENEAINTLFNSCSSSTTAVFEDPTKTCQHRERTDQWMILSLGSRNILSFHRRPIIV